MGPDLGEITHYVARGSAVGLMTLALGCSSIDREPTQTIEPTPLTTPATDPNCLVTIRSGDTLWEIQETQRAQGNDVTWQEIAQANDVSDPKDVKIGTVLNVCVRRDIPGTMEYHGPVETAPSGQPTEEGTSGRMNHEPLPDDIVSRADLASQYRTSIRDLPDVRLHIRAGALENEPAFNELKANPSHSLTIVLLDSSYIGWEFIPDDLKKELLPFESTILESMRQTEEKGAASYLQRKDAVLAKHDRMVAQFAQDLQDRKITQEQYSNIVG